MENIPARDSAVSDEDEQQYSVTKEDYQNILSTVSGQRVLAHLLAEYHFFQEIETIDEIAERNMLIRFLRNAGILEQKNAILLAQKLIDVGRVTN